MDPLKSGLIFQLKPLGGSSLSSTQRSQSNGQLITLSQHNRLGNGSNNHNNQMMQQQNSYQSLVQERFLNLVYGTGSSLMLTNQAQQAGYPLLQTSPIPKQSSQSQMTISASTVRNPSQETVVSVSQMTITQNEQQAINNTPVPTNNMNNLTEMIYQRVMNQVTQQQQQQQQAHQFQQQQQQLFNPFSQPLSASTPFHQPPNYFQPGSHSQQPSYQNYTPYPPHYMPPPPPYSQPQYPMQPPVHPQYSGQQYSESHLPPRPPRSSKNSHRTKNNQNYSNIKNKELSSAFDSDNDNDNDNYDHFNNHARSPPATYGSPPSKKSSPYSSLQQPSSSISNDLAEDVISTSSKENKSVSNKNKSPNRSITTGISPAKSSGISVNSKSNSPSINKQQTVPSSASKKSPANNSQSGKSPSSKATLSFLDAQLAIPARSTSKQAITGGKMQRKDIPATSFRNMFHQQATAASSLLDIPSASLSVIVPAKSNNGNLFSLSGKKIVPFANQGKKLPTKVVSAVIPKNMDDDKDGESLQSESIDDEKKEDLTVTRSGRISHPVYSRNEVDEVNKEIGKIKKTTSDNGNVTKNVKKRIQPTLISNDVVARGVEKINQERNKKKAENKRLENKMAISDELFQLSQESTSHNSPLKGLQAKKNDWSGGENGILYRVQTSVPVGDPNMWPIVTTRYNKAIEEFNEKQTGKKDKHLPFRTEEELRKYWFMVILAAFTNCNLFFLLLCFF
jgi:hypothetical protein